MSADVLRQLIEHQLADPHRVLGAHPQGASILLRVYRPDAREVYAIAHGTRHPLSTTVQMPGLFVGHLPREPQELYQLELHFEQDSCVEYDPYAFLPTLGAHDLHFLGEGKHRRLWERLGARPLVHHGVPGVAFAVWAPNAQSVALVGDFNHWDDRRHPMRSLGSSGLWELFVPQAQVGQHYKFKVYPRAGDPVLKADPCAFRSDVPPATASVVHSLEEYQWHDDSWLASRWGPQAETPMSIYEVHLGSWMRVPEEGHRSLTYRELAPKLAAHAVNMGFTHVELLPVAEHPFGGSWGYQVSGYYAPTARYGSPDDFRFLVDTLHQHGVGVIVDWVPAHFPRDDFALANFDGTHLYEHADPRRGAHPDWGTLIFNFGRNEVRNFLVANALFWLEQYHLDGLRVDAVASMLYLDYSRKPGEWVPNPYGGRENLEAIEFLKELSEAVRTTHPKAHLIAEESTSWPRVSAPTQEGGLGFTHKWNMGWMHDTLSYFQKEPIHRQHHHHQLTFGLLYAFSERFVLPLSHDEVVHGKGSLLRKMPGDDWQKFANLRALYGLMWVLPGKKLLFMGGEFGQWNEWAHDASLDWHLTEFGPHRGLMQLVTRLNALYRQEGALFESDFWPRGFQWVQADAAHDNVYIFIRRGKSGWKEVVCVANLSPVVRSWRVGLPSGGSWGELLNTDAVEFGGSNVTNAPQRAEPRPWDGQPASAVFTLPPLGVLWLASVEAPQSAI